MVTAQYTTQTHSSVGKSVGDGFNRFIMPREGTSKVSEMSMGLTNEEKAMLERLWIGIARQMDDEFQRVLEDLRGMCDTANSFAARLPNSRVAHGLVIMRLNDWHAHFTKYLEVASAHSLSTSPSYVETLTRVIKEIEEARESIKGAQGREVGQSQGLMPPGYPTANEQAAPPGIRRTLRNIKARRIAGQPLARVKKEDAPREQGGSTGSQQPPAPVAQQGKDPLREIARMREQEQKEVAEDLKKLQEMRTRHLKNINAILKKGR